MLMFQRPNTFGEAKFYPYKINQSVRYNDDDSAHLVWQPASDESSRTRWIWSSWMKRCNLPASDCHIFSVNQGSGWFRAWYRGATDHYIRIQEYDGSATRWMMYTNGLFRDPTSWHHILISFDSTDATTVDRLKLYINGLEASFIWSTGMSPNLESYVGTNDGHYIGSDENGTGEFDGYIAEPILVMQKSIQNGDYAITDFGKSKYGIWIPKRYTGSYGTNGFKLDFADENDFGNDVSGNNNDFTSSGLTSNDQVEDSPTNNYCTLSPLYSRRQSTNYSDGNLVYQTAASAVDRIVSTSCIPTYGKWTFEGLVEDPSNAGIGIQNYQDDIRDSYVLTGDRTYVGGSTAYGASYTTNDIIKVCVDVDSETLDFYKNNVHQGQIDISSRNYEWGSDVYFTVGDHSSSTNARWRCDFGQHGFNDVPPTGYKALCSKNIRELQKPSKSYDVYSDCGTEDDYSSGTYTGNGNVDGPFIYLGYYPTDVCIDGDHYDETSSVIDVLSNGFKLRSLTKNTNTTSYTWEAWVYQDGKYSNAALNVV